MKTLFSGVLIVLATGYVAMAQPAYSPDEGAAPANYPACTHRGQDRCMPMAAPMGHMRGHHGGKHHKGAHHMGAHHKGGHHKGGHHHAAHHKH